MPHPKRGYFVGGDKPSNRVPSVTTVLGAWGDKGGLIWWANNEGLEGRTLAEARDVAMDAGTVAHAMVDDDLHGAIPDPGDRDPRVIADAEAGYKAYRSWRAQVRLEVIDTELSMTHTELMYGGTLDFIGTVEVEGRKRELTLADWKVTTGTWPGHVYQLAAYRDLYEFNNPGTHIERFYSLRFGKRAKDGSTQGGDFHEHSFTREQMDIAMDCFKSLLVAYRIEKQVKRWVR